MHEWLNKAWYKFTTEYYSTVKKNEIMSFAMDGTRVHLIKSNRPDSERQVSHIFLHIQNTHICLHV